MILRSLGVFLLLCLAFAGWLHLVPVTWDTELHLANGNRIKAERFVFGELPTDATVIAGSSLAYRIAPDSFPQGTANLGFGGLSIHDGMALVLRSGQKPARVLVETNVIFRDPDPGFIDALFAPGLYQLREALPIMREEHQPSGILLGRLRAAAMARMANEPGEEAPTGPPDPVMYAENAAKYAEAPSSAERARFAALLQENVTMLEERGVEVIFFEMPIDEALSNSPLAAAGRELVQELFPKHPYLHLQADGPWRTTDGLHLHKGDAARASGMLRRAVLGR